MKLLKFSLLLFFHLVCLSTTYASFDPETLQADPANCYKMYMEYADATQSQIAVQSTSYALICEFYSLGDKKPFSHGQYKCYNSEHDFVLQGELLAYVCTPYRAFTLAKDRKESSFSITYISPVSSTTRAPAEIFRDDLRSNLGHACINMRLYAAKHFGHPSAFQSPGVVCKKVTKVNETSYKFDFINKQTPDPKTAYVAGGSFVIDRRYDFSVTDHQVDIIFSGINTSQKTILDYYSSPSVSVHSLKSINWKQTVGGKQSDNVICSYLDYKHEQIPAKMLTPEYYLVTDPLKSDAWPIWPFILIGVGIVGIGVYLWLRWRSRTV